MAKNQKYKKYYMDTIIDSILVPVDFREQSMIALKQSYNIAKLVNARIILLHVITGHISKNNGSGFNDDLDTLTDKLNAMSQEAVEQSGVPCSFHIENGRIVSSILETAKNINARFIFIGARKMTIGPITMRIIKEAPCPVFSIKGKHHRHGCHRIILPLDLTKTTTEKLDMTKKLASYFNSHVNVISASAPTKEFKLTRLRLLLEQVKDFFVNHEISCSTKLLKTNNKIDDIANGLMDYADDVEGDLIVIMIQQENPLKQKIMGSLARKIIMGSNIPVLCIQPNSSKKQ
jgi:nucleotide-binding universal stress UspA family protein